MRVTDFEMICPISRGAYGRVYKVKKKSTGTCPLVWLGAAPQLLAEQAPSSPPAPLASQMLMLTH
jgi:hypothetical protein